MDKDRRADETTQTFLGNEVTEEELKRYGKTLAEYFAILREWAQEKGS